jgi:hypothetical protein
MPAEVPADSLQSYHDMLSAAISDAFPDMAEELSLLRPAPPQEVKQEETKPEPPSDVKMEE